MAMSFFNIEESGNMPKRNTVRSAIETFSFVVISLAVCVIVLPRFFDISIQPILTAKFGLYALIVFVCMQVVYSVRQEAAIQAAKLDDRYIEVLNDHNAAYEKMLEYPGEDFERYCAVVSDRHLRSKRMRTLYAHGVTMDYDRLAHLMLHPDELAAEPKPIRRAVHSAARKRAKPLNAYRLRTWSIDGECSYTDMPASTGEARMKKTGSRILPGLVSTFIGVAINFNVLVSFSWSTLATALVQILFLLLRAHRGDVDGRNLILISTISYLKWRTTLYREFIQQQA